MVVVTCVLAALSAGALTADTHVRRVTVYSDRARVTRAGAVSLPEGRSRVMVSGLPDSLFDDTVAASLAGGRGKILSIEVEEEFGKRIDDARAKALLEQQKTLERKDQTLGDQIAALQAQQAFLQGLSVTPRNDEKGRPIPLTLDPASWQQTLSFAQSGMETTLVTLRARQKERSDLGKARAALQVQIDEIASHQSQASKSVALELEAAGGEVPLEVTYTLPGPSWRPAYDLRVLSSEGKVALLTRGVVSQATGEDWKEVELTLSTAVPQHGAEVPELLAWRLGDADQYAFAQANGPVATVQAEPAHRGIGLFGGRKAALAPAPPPPSEPSSVASDQQGEAEADLPAPAGAPAQSFLPREDRREVAAKQNERAPTSSIELDGKSYALPPPAIRQVSSNLWSLPAGHAFTFVNRAGEGLSWQEDTLYCPSPTASAGGFDYAYKPERKVTILSDGRGRKIPLAETRLAAALEYEVVAPLSTRAYLRSRVTNDGQRPILAGEAFVFLDDDFVGRSFLGTVAPRESVDLSLGTDDEVKVERRVEQSGRAKGVLSKKEKTAYTVKLTVKSYPKRPIEVLLRDQMPITSQKDDISIDRLEATPEPWVLKSPDGSFVDGTREAQGLYAWRLAVPAGGKSGATLSWSVEHPRDFDLSERRESP